MKNFDNYLFRCSSLGRIMTGVKIGLTENQEETYNAYNLRFKGEGRPLTANQIEVFHDLGAKKNAKPTLSQTTKTYLQEIHKEEIFGRRNEIRSKYLDKGIQVEEQSLSLYTEVTGELFLKNKERFNNEFITGEPDNKQGKIRDIKSSWSFETFPLYDTEITNKDYQWQLMGYMELTGLKESELVYCLIDTPEMLIEDEKRRMSWKLGMIELPEELGEEIEKNLTYSDIPQEMRVKVFSLEFSQKAIDALYSQIAVCREYMNELTIKLSNNPLIKAA